MSTCIYFYVCVCIYMCVQVDKMILNLEASNNTGRGEWLQHFHTVMTASGKDKIEETVEQVEMRKKKLFVQCSFIFYLFIVFLFIAIYYIKFFPFFCIFLSLFIRN